MTTSSSAVLLLLPLLLLSACLQDVRGDIESGSGESGSGESGSGDADLPSTCRAEFQEVDDHTMCLHDSEAVTQSGVSDEDKQIIVDLHNQLRAGVDPTATNMRKVIWDDKIAEIAQKWAMQCVVGHDKNRKVPSYGMGIGQNAAGGHGSWHGAVMGWYNEVTMFKYGQDPEVYLGKDGWKKIGHYTQVVQAHTDRIGCGFAICGGVKYYICNYGPGQQHIQEPYKSGDTCSACPDSCDNNLCDCGGKICKNGGTLNINTCTCACNNLYKGDTCEILNCPASDSRSCWIGYTQEQCTKFTNVPLSCPYMCGICGGPEGATSPPVITSPFGCTYAGLRPSAEECASYGDNGMDTWACASSGGSFNCQSCSQYSNVKTQYCPVMCGYCDGPCDGLTCMNGGTLNRGTCKCECKTPFTGDKCENVDCTISDASYCWTSYGTDYCQYTNVRDACPNMCGLCGETAATPPPVFTSTQGCEYRGQRPSAEECKQYGNKGKDTFACITQGGNWGCDECIAYSNVKTEYCPVTCGLCDP